MHFLRMAPLNATFTAQHLFSTKVPITEDYSSSGSPSMREWDLPMLKNFQYVNVSVRFMMGLLAIGGNLLTIVAISHYEYLRSCTNYLVAALAIGDLMAGLNCVMVLINYLTPMTGETWLNMCAVEFTLNQVSAGLNLSYILFISVDRFLFITFPLRYHSLVTPRLIARTVVLPIALIAIHFVAILLSVEDFEKNPGRICVSVYPKRVRSSIGVWVYVCMPCTMLLHTRIAWIAYKQSRAIGQTQNVAGNQEHKITKMLSLVLGVYLFCYMPQMIVLALKEYIAPDYFIIIERASSWIWWINSWANPFIYAWKSKDFNRAFRSLLQIRNFDINPVTY